MHSVGFRRLTQVSETGMRPPVRYPFSSVHFHLVPRQANGYNPTYCLQFFLDLLDRQDMFLTKWFAVWSAPPWIIDGFRWERSVLTWE